MIKISRLKSKYFDIPARLKSFTLELQRKPSIFLLAHAFFAWYSVCEKKNKKKKEGKHVIQKEGNLYNKFLK